MSLPSGKLEELALDQIEPQLVLEGYRVIRQPAPSQVPGFMQGYAPDAIAIGPDKKIAIEIKGSRPAAVDRRAQRLRQMFEGHDDWELRFIYFRPDVTYVEPLPEAALRERAGQVKALAGVDPQAAFVMAWAVLEGWLRAAAVVSERSSSARGLVSSLVAEGVVDPQDSAHLLKLADLRNQIAHGELDLIPTLRDVTLILDIAESLAAP